MKNKVHALIMTKHFGESSKDCTKGASLPHSRSMALCVIHKLQESHMSSMIVKAMIQKLATPSSRGSTI